MFAFVFLFASELVGVEDKKPRARILSSLPVSLLCCLMSQSKSSLCVLCLLFSEYVYQFVTGMQGDDQTYLSVLYCLCSFVCNLVCVCVCVSLMLSFLCFTAKSVRVANTTPHIRLKTGLVLVFPCSLVLCVLMFTVPVVVVIEGTMLSAMHSMPKSISEVFWR